MKTSKVHISHLISIKGIVSILILISIGLAYIIAHQNEKIGGAIIFAIVGCTSVIYSFINPVFGFYCATILGFIIFYFERLLHLSEGFGATVEILLYTTCIGVIFQKFLQKESIWKNLQSPISLVMLIFLMYILLEFFNTNSGSLIADLVYLRRILQQLLIYFIALNIFKNYRDSSNFYSVWLVLMTLCAMYGCFQEWHGFSSFENDFLFANDKLVELYSLDNGNFRKFSTLTDPTSFGILCAVSGLCTLVLLLTNKKNIALNLLYFSSLFFLILGMAYSGTRTAIFIFTLGLVLYILMSLNNKKTLLFCVISFMTFIIVIFGPIYSNQTINRIRSSFKINKNESMNVRNVNRAKIQPYIYAHPFGGGLGTTGDLGSYYNADHYLAGFPPDSGLLKFALEIGWIGLIVVGIFYFVILQKGVQLYYRSTNKLTKKFILIATVGIFANTVAQYAQVSIGQIPGIFFYFSLVAIIVKLHQFENITTISNLNTP